MSKAPRGTIRLAESTEDILACFPVMKQLRPRYGPEEFVDRVRRQQQEGYRLAMVTEGTTVVAVAGYRIAENLAWRKFMYVDDLVTDAGARSRGHGCALLDWLRQQARDAGCDELHLDSGVQRFDAHRFYLRHGMIISSHHFQEDL